MITRIHTTREGRIILQRQNTCVNDGSPHRWRMAAGPYKNQHLARQGELRYIKKVEMENPNRIPQQLISKNWGEIKF